MRTQTRCTHAILAPRLISAPPGPSARMRGLSSVVFTEMSPPSIVVCGVVIASSERSEIGDSASSMVSSAGLEKSDSCRDGECCEVMRCVGAIETAVFELKDGGFPEGAK